MDISIIIPCADDIRLAKCIESIDEDVEVIVALNGATEEIKDLVRGYGVRSCEIPERNLGAACNEGIKVASSQNILLMNSDCIFRRGTIRLLYEGLRDHKVARGRVIFESKGFISKVIARAREYTTTDMVRAYQPALAFRKDIVEDIGYYFDNDIHWTEDADFDRRIRRAGLEIKYIPDAIVYHPPLTIWTDLRSACRYGIGRRIAEEKKLVDTHPPFRLSLGLIFSQFADAKNKKGIWTAIYLTVWILAFGFGYYMQLVGDVYGVRRRIQSTQLSNY